MVDATASAHAPTQLVAEHAVTAAMDGRIMEPRTVTVSVDMYRSQSMFIYSHARGAAIPAKSPGTLTCKCGVCRRGRVQDKERRVPQQAVLLEHAGIVSMYGLRLGMGQGWRHQLR